jgi:malate dehydrogenase (quinone)
MGEAKIAGDGIPFNITPSPGASTALKNAMTDARTVLDFFDADREFDEAAFREATVERFPRVDDEAAANPDADDKPDEADGDDADRVPAEVDD